MEKIINVLKKYGCHMALTSVAIPFQAQAQERPNVIIVLTDDQGYGDLACHGNPYLKTPHLDKLHSESIRLTDFHVAPMSAPTRGQLLTGVDCLRNACMATCAGRSTVREEFPMAGEIFSSAGYGTGIFGKWHMGYNWPHRPMDRGFQHAVYFNGYGLTGMGHHWNSDYYDPFYYLNGDLKQANGYCNDFWFDEAMKWMKEKKDKPFFCFIPTNLAHFPDWIDTVYSNPYKSTGAAEFYGMVANVDENMGKLENFLVSNGLRDNTILIFLTDNGTVKANIYNAGMTGGKCTRTEGGHRVPCFFRWPAGKFISPVDIQTPTQVQDILPTLIDLCKIKTPANAKFDGSSIAPLLKGKEISDRMFVIQYQQLDLKKYDAAVVWNQWRLLYGNQLFNIKDDLAQKNDVAAAHPEVVSKMKAYYEEWWKGVEPRLNEFVPNHIGSTNQKEVILCSSDWQDVRADGPPRTIKPAMAKGGVWHLQVEKAGTYSIELRRWAKEADEALNAGLPEFIPRFGKAEPKGEAVPIKKATLVVDGLEQSIICDGSEKGITFNVKFKQGRSAIQAWFSDANGNALCGAFYAYVRLK